MIFRALVTVFLLNPVLSTALRRQDNGNVTECDYSFTLTSTGSISFTAGQLSDGQIRLNGSYSPSIFCLDEQGKMRDPAGFGCIITGPPVTQIQCDQGKVPTEGFSFDVSDNKTLLYSGCRTFYACPATDYEYNIYLAPDFGQSKCVPVQLQKNDCAGRGLHCPPPTLYWQGLYT